MEVLRGTKFFGLVEASFGDTSFVLVSSRRRSKLLVDLAGLRDNKLRDGESVAAELDDRRLLSLALERPIDGIEDAKKTTIKMYGSNLFKKRTCSCSVQPLLANQSSPGQLAR